MSSFYNSKGTTQNKFKIGVNGRNILTKNTDDNLYIEHNKNDIGKILTDSNFKIKTINNEYIIGDGNITIDLAECNNEIAGFITKTVEDLENFYNKLYIDNLSENEKIDDLHFSTKKYYNIDYINRLENSLSEKISEIPKFSIMVVDELPLTDISSSTIYLLRDSENNENLYTEYIYVNNKWEILGSQFLDLSGYATKEWVEEQNYLTDEDLPKYTSDLINDSGFITSDANNLKNYYTSYDIDKKAEIKKILENDLNNIVYRGVYDVSNVKNGPENATNGILTVKTNNSIIEQTFKSNDIFSYRFLEMKPFELNQENNFYINGVKTDPINGIINLAIGESYELSGFLNGKIIFTNPDGNQDQNLETLLIFDNCIINSIELSFVIDYPFTFGKLKILLQPNTYNYLISNLDNINTLNIGIINSLSKLIVCGYGSLNISSKSKHIAVKSNELNICGKPTIFIDTDNIGFYSINNIIFENAYIYVNLATNVFKTDKSFFMYNGVIRIIENSDIAIYAKNSGLITGLETQLFFANASNNISSTITVLENVMHNDGKQNILYSDYFGDQLINVMVYDPETDSMIPGEYTIDDNDFIFNQDNSEINIKGYFYNNNFKIYGENCKIILNNAYISTDENRSVIQANLIENSKLEIIALDNTINYIMQYSSYYNVPAINSSTSIVLSGNGTTFISSKNSFGLVSSSLSIADSGQCYFLKSKYSGIRVSYLFCENSTKNLYVLNSKTSLSNADIFVDNTSNIENSGFYNIDESFNGFITTNAFKSINGKLLLNNSQSHIYSIESIIARKGISDDNINIYKTQNLNTLINKIQIVYGKWNYPNEIPVADISDLDDLFDGA